MLVSFAVGIENETVDSCIRKMHTLQIVPLCFPVLLLSALCVDYGLFGAPGETPMQTVSGHAF